MIDVNRFDFCVPLFLSQRLALRLAQRFEYTIPRPQVFAVRSHQTFMELVRIAGQYRLKGRLSSGSSRTSEALHSTSVIWLTSL